MLDDTLAWVGAELLDLVPGGDHTIGIGAVKAAETGGRGEPLIWFRGRYGGAGVTALHIVLGVAVLAVNAAAGAYGALAWWRHADAPGFWPLLRTGQALVALQAVLRRRSWCWPGRTFPRSISSTA